MQELAFGLQTCVIVGVGAAVMQALHQRGVIVDAAANHPGLHQAAEAFVEHFAAAVQALLEGIEPTVVAHQWVSSQAGVQCIEHGAITRVVGMPQHQRMAEGIGEGADADLQCAAVAHQGACI